MSKSYNRMSVDEFMKEVRKDTKSREIKSYGEHLNDKLKKKLKGKKR